MSYTPAKQLSEDDIKKMAVDFICTLSRSNDKKAVEKEFEPLIKTMSDMIRQLKPEMNTRDLHDKNCIKQLSAALISVISLKKPLTNKNLFAQLKLLSADKELLKKLQFILKPENRHKLNNPDELNKFFSPAELKKLKELLKKCRDEIAKDLKRFGLDNPTSPFGRNAGDKLDRYENLFGLALSSITGSIATVVQSFMGNGLGFDDVNPNNGAANIDRIDNPHNSLDDPLSLNVRTMANYLQNSSNEFTDDFQKELSSTFSSTPKLTRH